MMRSTFRLSSLLLATTAHFASACSSSTTVEPDRPPVEVAGDVFVKPQPRAACTTNTLPLTLTYEDGAVHSQVVPVKVEDVEGWLAIDTGAAQTFLIGPERRGVKRDAQIGCETLRLASHDAVPEEELDGKPIIGVLGADFFTGVTTDFDYPGKKITRYLKKTMPRVDGYLTVPFVDVGGHIGVNTKVDGVPSLLLFDTGSHTSSLVPAEGRPTDEKIVFGDIGGGVNEAFLGPSELTIGTETRQVPVKRVPSWPYFEGYAKELSPDLKGVLGLTGMGHRRIVVRKQEGTIELGPIVPLP